MQLCFVKYFVKCRVICDVSCFFMCFGPYDGHILCFEKYRWVLCVLDPIVHFKKTSSCCEILQFVKISLMKYSCVLQHVFLFNRVFRETSRFVRYCSVKWNIFCSDIQILQLCSRQHQSEFMYFSHITTLLYCFQVQYRNWFVFTFNTLLAMARSFRSSEGFWV